MLKQILERVWFFFFFPLGYFFLLKSFKAVELEGCAKQQWILLIACIVHKEGRGQNLWLTAESELASQPISAFLLVLIYIT